MDLDRRRFLMSLGALAAARPAWANLDTAAARNLVIVLAGGGWDTTYVFDPKPDSGAVDTGVGDYAAFGSGSIWVHEDRPSVTEFFDRYGSITAMINGLNVPSVAHGSCMQRVLSGFRDITRPDIGAIVGHELGLATPMPYLDVSGQARPGRLGADLGYMGTSNQLGGLVFRSHALKPVDRSTWKRHWASDVERDLVRAYVEQRSAGLGARVAHGENARRHASFVQGIDRSHQLLDFEDFFDAVPSGRDFADQAAVATRALSAGLCQTVILSGDGSFDTHQNNVDQVGQYEATFAGVIALMESLEATPGRVASTLLDESVVLICSEMGRTPRLNDDAGKDHWPFTSCLVAGAGIAGGQILGGTDETLAALPMDVATGQLDPSGTLIQSEHLHAALLELFGVDPERYFPGTTPLRAIHA
jgi:hypothetical protein